jgi:hypothetical protein
MTVILSREKKTLSPINTLSIFKMLCCQVFHTFGFTGKKKFRLTEELRLPVLPHKRRKKLVYIYQAIKLKAIHSKRVLHKYKTETRQNQTNKPKNKDEGRRNRRLTASAKPSQNNRHRSAGKMPASNRHWKKPPQTEPQGCRTDATILTSRGR